VPAKARERIAVYFKEDDAKITTPFKARYDDLNRILAGIKANGLSQTDALLQRYKILETELKFEVLLAD